MSGSAHSSGSETVGRGCNVASYISTATGTWFAVVILYWSCTVHHCYPKCAGHETVANRGNARERDVILARYSYCFRDHLIRVKVGLLQDLVDTTKRLPAKHCAQEQQTSSITTPFTVLSRQRARQTSVPSHLRVGCEAGSL